jgi:arsenate reductase
MNQSRVLFLCTHNSARSQMAEGLLRSIAGDRFEAHSAGTEATFVRPEAITVMGEIGVDISGQTSKALGPLLGEPFDWVITVCDQAKESCPIFPGARATAHWSIDDPAAVTGSEPGRLAAFRAARDELRSRVAAFVSAVRSEVGFQPDRRPS